MGTRILTFHRHESGGNSVFMSPSAYYLEANYTPVAVRIYSETAPVSDAKFDIYDDGVSIFANRTPTVYNVTSGVDETGEADTTIFLPKGSNSEEIAEDFNTELLEVGSWISCKCVDYGGGGNMTVQFEIYSQAEELGEEE